MKPLLTTILLFGLTACSSTLSAPPPGQGLLAGVDNSEKRIMMRSIDDGEILWIRGYKLGTTTAISPGQHKVSIMCEFIYDWGTRIVPGNIEINISPNVIYTIDGVASSDGETCVATVRA